MLSPQALLHPEAHEEGGFGFTNKELLAKQRGVVTDIIKEVCQSPFLFALKQSPSDATRV